MYDNIALLLSAISGGQDITFETATMHCHWPPAFLVKSLPQSHCQQTQYKENAVLRW